MKPEVFDLEDEFGHMPDRGGEGEVPSDQDLWFLPSPIVEEPDDLLSSPWAEAAETSILADWTEAEAGFAAQLARVAGRLGALDERL